MPSVTPSDGGYNYYQKTLSELEDELKTEAKRSREREKAATESLEAAHKRNLADRERQAERTINEIKDSANRTIAQERDYNKNELDRIKANTYDKWGRFGGVESDVARQQLQDLRQATDAERDKASRDLRLAEDHYAERMEEAARGYEERLEKNAAAARDSANKSYSSAYQGEKAEYAQFKEEAEKKYGELTQEHLEELRQERKRSERAINDSRLDFDRKAKTLRESNDDRFEKLDNAYQQRVTHATQNLNDSRDAETRQLRDQVKELLDSETRYIKEKGQGTQDAIDEYDRDWRAKERNTVELYEREIDKLKRSAKEQDRYFTHLNNKNLRDKDAYFTGVISQVNLDNRQEKKDLEETFKKDRGQLELQLHRERDQSRLSREKALNEASMERARLLEVQAKNYQDTMERQHRSSDEQIKKLQAEINYRNTSDDTTVISPAAEAAVRKSMIGEYEKVLGAERDRNDRNVDSMQREYTRRVNDTVEEKRSSETQIRKQNNVDREIERNRLLAHIQDTEFMKDQGLRHKEYENTKMVDNINRNYANILENQRREFNDVITSAKTEAAFQMNSMRQQHDFETKMAHRTFTAKQNELIREYDKKLADQKAEYETQLGDMKSQTQLALRDAERKTKQALEEQQKSYEQRLAQTEYQHKERERYMTENFQDQLEKVKRSNALIAQKKG